jgi:hypothetical protein
VFAPEALVFHAVAPRGIRDAIAERWHWTQDIPGLVRLVPELREEAFYRRWFFDDWTAKFELAFAGAVLAGVRRRPLSLIAAIPYLECVGRGATVYRVGPGSWPERIVRAAVHAASQPAVDAATVAGLISGSIFWRSPVL